MSVLTDVTEGVRARVAKWAGKATQGPIPMPEGYYPAAIPFYTGFSPDDWNSTLGRMTPAEMYASQPYLRLVVDFLARNIAQLGVHVFDRLDEDRQRVTTGPMAELLRRPNPTTTRYELFRDLVSDLALHDRAYWLLTAAPDAPAGFELYQLPAPWVTPVGGNRYGPAAYEMLPADASGPTVTVPAANVLAFHGWSPGHADRGLSPVATLKEILGEQVAAHRFREQLWRRSGRVNAYLTRPAAAPIWGPEAEAQFKEDWRASWTGEGGEAGGTPLLQDGMELKRIGYSAHEDEFVDASKLALTTVAGVYHINPTMIGQLDSANYSNVREFRRMLYGDTLGPILAALEDRQNAFLLPRLGEPPERYVEFNIAEKLQGSFEEQAAVMSTLVGAPIMTPNEGRARFNLPAVEGGDQLVVPMNVTVGGQASPQDGGDPATPPITDANSLDVLRKVLGYRVPELPEAKAKPRTYSTRATPAPQWLVDDSTEALAHTFKRQADAIASAVGGAAKRGALLTKADGTDEAPEWWDGERWDSELTDDMHEVAMKAAAAIGPAHAKALGYDPDDFDVERMNNFLQSVAASRAKWINSTTVQQVQDSLADLDDPAQAPAAVRSVFDEAIAVRAAMSAATFANTLSNLTTNEVGHQFVVTTTVDGRTSSNITKTWIVTSANPRPEHADMDGETVAVDDVFSNGANWPGDPVLGADGVAGCTCVVDINRKDDA
jgi:HK97 family phage portal protein